MGAKKPSHPPRNSWACPDDFATHRGVTPEATNHLPKPTHKRNCFLDFLIPADTLPTA